MLLFARQLVVADNPPVLSIILLLAVGPSPFPETHSGATHDWVSVFSALISTTVGRSFSLLTLFTMLAPVVRAQVRFQKPDFDTGKGPVSISVADFNRDGLPDVVT